jgi:predicted PhzF superfamily epimerase YddE/YHI9
VAVRLATVEEVLAIRPRYADLDIGMVALYPPAGPVAIEVRALFPKDGAMVEDPVTGSLNASLAQWLLGTGVLTRTVRGESGQCSAGPGGPTSTRTRWHHLGGRRDGDPGDRLGRTLTDAQSIVDCRMWVVGSCRTGKFTELAT